MGKLYAELPTGRKLFLAGAFCIASMGNAFSANNIELLSRNGNTSTVKFSINNFDKHSVQTPLGEAFVISTEQGARILEKGAPDLQLMATSLIIPENMNMGVTVIDSKYTDYENIEIAPSKGNFTRDIDPSTVEYTWNNSYQKDEFYPGKLTELREPYILRDFRGQTILVYPFQYNPIKKTLRVYSEITVKVSPANYIKPNAVIEKPLNAESIDAEFAQIYKNIFLNGNETMAYTPLTEEGNMLIICYGQFMSAMQPFVDWKNRKGIKTEIVDIKNIGNNSTSIKNYVKNYYNSKGLKYLLLVGDAEQITPKAKAAGDSDNDYGYLVGNDSYPEIFVGRFSANKAAEAKTMVDRVLLYEKNPLPGATWYKNGLAIGSSMGPGDDNEYDWQHQRNIRSKLMNYNYVKVSELYDGNQGGDDKSGDPTPQDVKTVIEAGCSVMNYTGHGSSYGSVTSGFSSFNVKQLTNTSMWPAFWAVACVNGDFVGQDCYAEAWLRASDPATGKPTGAIATLMSTVNQSWDPPMEGQDEFNDILVESITNNIKRTFGGISMNGCMGMNDKYGTAGTNMTDTWTIFGDPSVMLFTNTPKPMTVSHKTFEAVGVSSLKVNCNIEGALIALSYKKQLIGSGAVKNGLVNISFTAISNPSDSIIVTATSYNKVPYFGSVKISPVGIDNLSNSDFDLSINPNKINSSANIVFTMKQNEAVSIKLYNAIGQEAKVICNKVNYESGTHKVSFEKGDLNPGIYFCNFSAGGKMITKKIIIMD